jgi:hypothetical protein
MTMTRSDAERAAWLVELADRNKATLAALHRAAQAIADDDPDYAAACQAEAAARLRPRWHWLRRLLGR